MRRTDNNNQQQQQQKKKYNNFVLETTQHSNRTSESFLIIVLYINDIKPTNVKVRQTRHFLLFIVIYTAYTLSIATSIDACSAMWSKMFVLTRDAHTKKKKKKEVTIGHCWLTYLVLWYVHSHVRAQKNVNVISELVKIEKTSRRRTHIESKWNQFTQCEMWICTFL